MLPSSPVHRAVLARILVLDLDLALLAVVAATSLLVYYFSDMIKCLCTRERERGVERECECERVVCLMRDQRGNRLLLRVSFGRGERIKVDLEEERKSHV
jgi:hypothetical protein